MGAGGPLGPPQFIGGGVGHHGMHHATHPHHLGGGATVVMGAGGAPGYTTVVHPHHAPSASAYHPPQQPHHRFRKGNESSICESQSTDEPNFYVFFCRSSDGIADAGGQRDGTASVAAGASDSVRLFRDALWTSSPAASVLPSHGRYCSVTLA